MCERSLHPAPLPLQTAQYGMHPDPSLQANWSDGQDRKREERFVDSWYLSKGFGFSRGFKSEGIFARVCHLENKSCCSLKMPFAMSLSGLIATLLSWRVGFGALLGSLVRKYVLRKAFGSKRRETFSSTLKSKLRSVVKSLSWTTSSWILRRLTTTRNCIMVIFDSHRAK